jgi:multidrug efflux pump subunit AcrA (membrane-fusion protein)
MESVLDEHATRADPTLVLGQNLFVAVSRVAQVQEQENVHRLQSRSWPPLHSRVQTVFAEAEARAKAAVKAEAKAKAKVAEEVAMATAKAAAAAAAAAAAETAKQAAKEAAEEANRERLERYKAHEQVPPICPLACLTHLKPLLKPTQSHSHSICAGRGGRGKGGGDESQALAQALAQGLA